MRQSNNYNNDNQLMQCSMNKNRRIRKHFRYHWTTTTQFKSIVMLVLVLFRPFHGLYTEFNYARLPNREFTVLVNEYSENKRCFPIVLLPRPKRHFHGLLRDIMMDVLSVMVA